MYNPIVLRLQVIQLLNYLRFEKHFTSFCFVFLIFSGFHLNGQSYDVEWTNFINTSANGNILTKVSGGVGWNGGAISQNKIPANIDGWLEFTVPNSSYS